MKFNFSKPLILIATTLLGAWVVLTAIFVLIGWQFNIEVLKRLIPGLVAMNPTTATCFALLGMANMSHQWRRPRWQAVWFRNAVALAVASVGLTKLIDLHLNTDTGVDRWIFASRLLSENSLNINAMAPNTSLNFVLTGFALGCISTYRPRFVIAAQLLAATSIVCSVVALIGYAYGALSLYHIANYFPMALNTALTFIITDAALLLRYPRRGLAAIITYRDLGGETARRLLLSVTLIPFLLGLILILTDIENNSKASTNIALFVTANILVLVVIVLFVSQMLHQTSQRLSIRNRELVKANQLADAASQAKSQFLANMSHEIRTPMNGVLGMLEIIEQTQLSESQRRMLETIRSSGQSLLGIINDILDFSKIEAGQMDVDPVPCDVGDLLEDVARLFLGAAQRKDILLRCFVAPDLRGQLQVDALRLRQVLSNVISNAIKFTSSGQVTLYAQLIINKSSDGIDRRAVSIIVEDTGIGISSEAQQRLFQPFTQGEYTTTRQFGGTGLGLSISRRLMELMGGTLDLKSELGKGTCLTLLLPARLPPDSKGYSKPSAELTGVRVLLACADTIECRHVTDGLRYWGATVQPCGRDPAVLVAQLVTLIGQGATSVAEPLLIVGPENQLRSRLAALRGLSRDLAPSSIPKLTPEPASLTPSLGDKGGFSCRFVLYRHEQLTVDEHPDADVIITTALSRARLVTAVAIAAGRCSPELEAHVERVPLEMVAEVSRGQALAQGRLVLVAEDHPVNRDVVLQQLRLIGYAADAVSNGVEAWEAMQRTRYGLLLTDCHMPELDGFGLTAKVRAHEREQAGIAGAMAPIPIVALTANAMKDEANRCLAAGMNDYLAKPVEIAKLRDCLQHWLSPPRSNTQEVSAEPASQPMHIKRDVLNLSILCESIGDDPRHLQKMLESYLESVSEELMQLVQSQPAEQIRYHAHRIKGASLSVGAQILAEFADQLESAAVTNDEAQIVALKAELTDQFKHVCAAAAAYRHQNDLATSEPQHNEQLRAAG